MLQYASHAVFCDFRPVCSSVLNGMSGQIFINYRRGDEPGFTQALLGRLEQAFPADRLFIDVDNIPPGEDFVHVLESQVAQCDVLLAVIGKGWLDATDEYGSRRLDDPKDFVRIEIESALRQGKRVIPVLVHDARMPRPDELPEALRPLARRNAVRLTHERFRADVQGLVKALERSLEEVAAVHRSQAEAEAARRAEDERQLREAEAERRAEEEERRNKAEQEARERAAEERRRQQSATKQRAEEERAFTVAKRANTVAAIDAFLTAYPAGHLTGEAQKLTAVLLARAEENERRRLAEREAKEHAAEERRLQKAAAEQRAQEERAFAAAKHAISVAAIDTFLTAYPAGHLAGEAQKLKAALRAREEAYDRAMASGDPVVLRSFRDAYKKGTDVDQVRVRLRLFEPEPKWPPKPTILIMATFAVILIGGAVVWLAMRPGSNSSQVSVAASPPPAPAVQPATSAPPEAKAQAADSAPTVAPPTPTFPTLAPAAAPVPSPDEVAWALLKDTTDDAALRRFTAQYSSSPLRKDAEARIAALAAAQAAKPVPPSPEQIAWNLVKDSKDPEQLRRFVEQFPNGMERPDAEQRIASLSASAPKVAISNAPDPHELARALQFELQRVGCFIGTVNGEFDDATKAAWHRFIKLTSISMPDDASSDAINAVRGITKRVCPLECQTGEHAEGGTCVANAPSPKRTSTGAQPSQPSAPPSKHSGSTVVDNTGTGPGKVIQGGVTTCGKNGCQFVPKNCHAVTGAGGHGLGGRIICP